MTIQKKISLLENLVLEQGRDQLLYLQNRATELQLTDEEYLDYLCCYLKEATKRGGIEMLILKHKGTKDIKCEKCGVTITCGEKTIGKGIAKVRCWDIPTGWNITLPNGWLCPSCKL